MKELPDLKQLSESDKDRLIESLWDELQKLRVNPAKTPKKTSKNSSLPPAQGFKASLKAPSGSKAVQRTASLGRVGGGRKLTQTPDQMIHAQVKRCKTCGASLSQSIQQLMQRYDKIEIPPIRPVVTQVERYGCTCPNCGDVQLAAVPIGMEPGSPFGDGVAALVTTLRYAHAISYARLSELMSQLFNLSISEGALANLFGRVKTQLEPTIEAIVQRLRSSRLVGSDETSARLQGKTVWEWVFQNDQICLHVIRPSRGADVIDQVMGEHRPEIWVSDLFSAQKKHPALDWQVCLAHQLRDCQYGIDAGDEGFSPVMKRLLLRAFVWQRRWEQLG